MVKGCSNATKGSLIEVYITGPLSFSWGVETCGLHASLILLRPISGEAIEAIAGKASK